MRFIMFSWLVLVPAVVVGGDPEMGAKDTHLRGAPACEPRSASAPGRLNVEASGLRHGVIPPCEAAVDFYIPRNAALGGLTGTLRYLNSEGAAVLESPFEIILKDGGNGLFQDHLIGQPAEGVMCRELELDIELSGCFDRKHFAIDCPPVRVKKSYVFEELVVNGERLDVCAD